MLPIMAAPSPPGPMLEESSTAAMSKSWNPRRTQVDVSALSGPVWPMSPVRNSRSSVSFPRHRTNSWASWASCGEPGPGPLSSISTCRGSPVSRMQDCSSLDSWDIKASGSFMSRGTSVPDSGVVSEGASVGVGIGLSVGAGTSVGAGISTGAVVGAGMDAAVGAWAAAVGAAVGTAVGDELVSGPEQAKRVVRATKSAQ